jgi:hypothetical protein
MRVSTLVVATVLALSSTPAHALFYYGNEFYEMCGSEDVAPLAVCTGFVMGVADTREFFLTVSELEDCMPKTATVQQLRDVVYAYLQDHPETRHYSAAGMTMAAFDEAFGCPEQ